ncbi:hypothetical protein JCM5350_003637 [Sporobolomyces pararoseus]
MPHTNNQYAVDRKASRTKNKPAFLQKKQKKPSNPTETLSREDQTALIREFHALEKRLKAPQTTEQEKLEIKKRQEELGGLETYQKASLHGADKKRGGETSKWLIKQLKQFKVGLDNTNTDKGKEKEKEKVEPTILEDGTKVWPKPKQRRKLKLLDVGAIAGTAYASEAWIDTTSIDLNPQAPHVIKSNFFDFPIPTPSTSEDELFDVVSLSLVMNFEGSLINRGHFLLHAHSYLKLESPGYLYLVLPLPCLTNSRYLTHQHLRSIFTSTNWEVVAHHDSNKLTHWFLKEINKDKGGRRGDGKIWKREELRKGVTPRNNFCIVVKPDEEVERGVEGEKEKEITGEEEEEETVQTETVKNGKGKGKGKGKKEVIQSKPQAQAQPQKKNNKRKAEDDAETVEVTKGEGGGDGEGEGEDQKKKKAKKSKPIKGKKIVFGDDE